MDNFVGRKEDIRNITGYLDFTTSDVQVVHIVGPPGFGKSTLAKKIGEILVRRRIKVFYVDLGMVEDINALFEHVMMNIVDDSKEEFLQAMKSLKEASSRKNVRYILTSQKREADIGNFRLHAIYNLSSVAAIELLDRLAPSLTDDQKMQIADLTGNVPLALDVVGAIFRLPDAPTPEEVIEGLKKNLVRTLSPAELYSNVDGSISLAYHYLTPELKELCVNLSNFPGSFDRASALAIFDFKENMLEMLVQRSLLQYELNVRRFHFHPVLILEQNNKEDLERHFNDKFLIHFAKVLHTAIPDNGTNFDLDTLRGEADNIFYMVLLVGCHNSVNATYFAIKVLSHEPRLDTVARLIPPTSTRFMLYCLDSYSPEERDSVECFLDTYIQVAVLVAKFDYVLLSLPHLKSIQNEVDEGYKQGTVTLNTFVKFYTMLGQLYNMTEDEKNWRHCHTHILRKTKGKLQDCYPRCDYFSISIAYESVGDKVQAFHFRKLAYRHQLMTLTPMNVIKLQLLLYNDCSLGNDAKALSLSIMEYLIDADKSEYSKEVYYAAIEFFRGQNMKENEIQLQKKIYMYTFFECDSHYCLLNSQWYRELESTHYFCPARGITAEYVKAACNYICAEIYERSAADAYERQYYYLAIWSGEQSLKISNNLGHRFDGLVGCASSIIVGKSYNHTGNYSAAKMWPKNPPQCFKKTHQPKLNYKHLCSFCYK